MGNLYNDKNLVQRGKENVSKVILPGDCVLTNGIVLWNIKSLFKNIGQAVAYSQIRANQKKVYYYNPPSLIKGIYKNTHITLHFGNEFIKKHIGTSPKVIKNLQLVPNADTFSCEPPKALLISLDSYCLDHISIWRRNNKVLDDRDIQIQCQVAEPLLETSYDILDLLGIADSVSRGKPFQRFGNVLNSGTDKRVCSTAFALIQKLWRDRLQELGINIPRDFSLLNTDAWSEEFQKDFYDTSRKELSGKWDVESVFPDNYSNCFFHFNKEWKFVAELEKGDQIA